MKYIKNELKELREKIRSTRIISKIAKDMWDRAEAQCDLHHLKQDFRCRHILYCLMKGCTYKQIESNVSKDNEVMESLLRTVCLQYSMFDWNEISEEQKVGLV